MSKCTKEEAVRMETSTNDKWAEIEKIFREEFEPFEAQCEMAVKLLSAAKLDVPAALVGIGMMRLLSNEAMARQE